MLIKALYDLTAGQMMRRHLFCLSVFGFWNDPFPENGNYNCVQGGETSAENESFCCEQGQKLLLRMRVTVECRGRTLLRVEKTKYRSRVASLRYGNKIFREKFQWKRPD